MLTKAQQFFMIFGLPAIIMLGACVPSENQTIQIIGPKPKELVDIPLGAKLAPIKLDRIAIKIRPGSQIGEADRGALFGCTFSGFTTSKLFWDRGRMLGKDVKFSDTFFEVFKNANYFVLGDPNKMFASAIRETVDPAYLIGASIDGLNLKVCDQYDAWYGIKLIEQKVTAKLKIRWQVFSTLKRKVVYETKTEGGAKISRPNDGATIPTMIEAFANAAENFAHDKKFFKLVSNPAPSLTDIRAVDKTKLLIERQKLSRDTITKNIDLIRLGVVTVDTGLGHGSGVFITPNALLTNHHVVGGNKIVRITLITGRKILGEVIRKHQERDVALVQVEEGGFRPLSIRNKSLKLTEEVYAIGSPIDRD